MLILTKINTDGHIKPRKISSSVCSCISHTRKEDYSQICHLSDQWAVSLYLTVAQHSWTSHSQPWASLGISVDLVKGWNEISLALVGLHFRCKYMTMYVKRLRTFISRECDIILSFAWWKPSFSYQKYKFKKLINYFSYM